MKSLEEKMAELKAKHDLEVRSLELKNKIIELFPDIKQTVFISSWKQGERQFLNFEAKDVSEFQQVFNTLKPTNKTTTISYAGKQDTVHNTPYRVTLKNPAKTNQWSQHTVSISYEHKDYYVSISLPVDTVEPFVTRSLRKITSSEYHYFTGYSQAELNRTNVTCYKWDYKETWKNKDTISWYGGDQSMINVDYINEIINHLVS